MSARAKLQGVVLENALLIPKQSIVDRNRRKVVFRINDNQVEEENLTHIVGWRPHGRAFRVSTVSYGVQWNERCGEGECKA